MRVILDKVEGDQTIAEDTTLVGVIAGNVKVESGVFFALVGTVTGNVEVENMANVEIHGVTVGDVINRNGDILIKGVVVGNVIRKPGRTEIAPGAVIRGKVLP
jgi:cytoskeletal protein CcmA (bactofilin family)